MKISEGFILKEIAGSYVVVPVGQNLVDFSSMITTNETGAFLWEKLQNDTTVDELCEAVMAEYQGVSREDAVSDIEEFINILKEKNILEQ
ncbi:MAG: PqqD family protein [Clostridia bacterium]|nr:PqqD family protein [Clostridia bacterium]